MALPANISTRWVEGQFTTNVMDGNDPDQKPDAIPARGIVTFVANVSHLVNVTADPNPATMLMIPRVAVLDDEGYLCTPVRGTLDPAYRGVQLECTDDPDGSVVDWTWSATYAFQPIDGVTPVLKSKDFHLPEGEEPLDLTRVVEIPSSKGIGKEQAEALAASAQAAAVRAAADAEQARVAAEEALSAAVATDSNVSSLVGTEGTETNAAVARQVAEVAAAKLDVDEAASTYQSIDGLDAVAASKINAENTSLRQAVDARARAAAASKLDATQAADTFQTKEGAAETFLAKADAATMLAAKPVNGARAVGQGELVINVCDYGAKGDWTANSNGTDNLAPFNAAYAAAVAAGRTLFIPDGKYRFSGEWDIYRPNTGKAISIVGQSREGTWLVSDFYGASKALVRNYDPLFNTRGASTSYFNLQFRTTSRAFGANPVFMNNGGWGESIMDHVKFGPSNNTHFRGTSLQNIRCIDTVSYYGGRNFLYKSTDGMTFTVALPGTITASQDVFSSADIGMLFFLSPPNDTTRIVYRISGVTDPRNATIDTVETPVIAATVPSKGNFDAALGSMAAGSNVLTANAPCFTQSDVGRVIVVVNARQGAYGKAILRAAITGYNSPTEVTLETAADLAVTNTPFALPVFDVASPKGNGLLSASSTDIKWANLHIEAYTGLGLSIIDGLQWHINDMKIHGEHDPTDARMSTGMAWFDDMAGVFSGEFDGGSTSSCRMFFSNMNDTLKIPYLSTRRVRNETLFIIEDWTENGGFVEMGTLVSYRHDDAGPEKFVIDRGFAAGHGRKLAYTTAVTMIGGNTAPRIYSGMGTYFTPDGRLVRGGSAFADGFDATFAGPSGSRVQFENVGVRRWSLGNSGSLFSLYDESAKSVRLQVNTNGDLTPGAASTQNLGSSAMKWKDFYAERAIVGGISQTSGVGSPEGVVTAPVGSEYVNTAGAAGAIRWGKKAGSGATGWVALW